LAYRFLIYDKSQRLVAERVGETFLKPGEDLILFEPNVQVQERQPARVFLELSPGRELHWERQVSAPTPELSFVGKEITIDPIPKLTGVIKNSSAFDVRNIRVVAVLYDSYANVIAVSATDLDKLEALTEERTVFTWPKEFVNPVASSEVYFHIPEQL